MHDSPGPRDPPLHAGRAGPDDPTFGRVLPLVRLLRERCPWDRRQDPRSLRPYLLEEAHEVAEAIDAGDDAALLAELGDLLLNIAFQVVLAEERGAFGAREVIERLEAKMAARHPHIYGDADEPPDWEALKAAERQARATGTAGADRGEASEPPGGAPRPEGAARAPTADPFAGIPAGLEPLSRALRLLDRASALGFEWPDAQGPLTKLEEERRELAEALDAPGPARSGAAPARIEEELGDLLLAAVAVARACRVHPSNALLRAGSRFERRFLTASRLAQERAVDWAAASLEEMRALWREAKEEQEEED